MKSIPLTQGKESIVDDNMYEILSTKKWSASKDHDGKFRAFRGNWLNPKIRKEFIHWYVIGNPIRGYVVDHINGDPLDNRRGNLRVVSYRENNQNYEIHRHGKLVGACFNKRRNKWMGAIWINGKQKHLGYFKTEKAANSAYLKTLGGLKWRQR